MMPRRRRTQRFRLQVANTPCDECTGIGFLISLSGDKVEIEPRRCAISMATTSRAQTTAASVKMTEIAALNRRESTVKARMMSSAIRGKSSAKSASKVGLQVSSGPLGAAASRVRITGRSTYPRSASMPRL